MAKHRTEELAGALLDAAVAAAEGEAWLIRRELCGVIKRSSEGKRKLTRDDLEQVWVDEDRCFREYTSCVDGTKKGAFWLGYSQQWELGGPLIEREGIRLERVDGPGHFNGDAVDGPRWLARHPSQPVNEMASEPLVAAMRAYVAAKFGSEIELPDVTT